MIGLLILSLSVVVVVMPRKLSGAPATASSLGGVRGRAARNFEEIMGQMWRVLRHVLSHVPRLIWENLLTIVSNAAWPVLTLAGAATFGLTAHGVQAYLHLLSSIRTCTSAVTCREFAVVRQQVATWESLRDIASIFLLATLGAAAILGAAALLRGGWPLAKDEVDFLFPIVTGVVVTFWLFSLTLSLFNGIASLLGWSHRVPFPQPGVSTVASGIAFVVVVSVILVKRWRNPPRRSTEPALLATSHTVQRDGGKAGD